MTKITNAEHGSICTLDEDFFGYFGWPTVARLENGTIAAVASGLRHAHVCPFGRTVLSLSTDEGNHWTSPRVINDTPLDDRDAGVVGTGAGGLLISWFSSDSRIYGTEEQLSQMDPVTRSHWESGLLRMNDEHTETYQGSWVRSSKDGGLNWTEPLRVPVSSPHGPIRLKNGDLLYLGKEFGHGMDDFLSGDFPIRAIRSSNGGSRWESLGDVPVYPGTAYGNYHEPHAVELPSGKLIGAIRVQDFADAPKIEALGLTSFSIMQTESLDGGRTWTQAAPLGFHGSPPHLMRHSSGALILSYGYRLEPFGERVAISRNEGATWDKHFILRDDGPDSDLGYPSAVELTDGRILSVYYQKPHRTGEKCALLYSKWELPEAQS